MEKVHDATWALPVCRHGCVSNLGSPKLCVIKVFSRRDCHLGGIPVFFCGTSCHVWFRQDTAGRGRRARQQVAVPHCEVIPQVNLAWKRAWCRTHPAREMQLFYIYIYTFMIFYVFVAIHHLNASAACACHGPSKALFFLILNSIPSLFVARDLAWLALSI